MTVQVNVISGNDNDPVFDALNYYVQLSEASTGTSFVVETRVSVLESKEKNQC